MAAPAALASVIAAVVEGRVREFVCKTCGQRRTYLRLVAMRGRGAGGRPPVQCEDCRPESQTWVRERAERPLRAAIVLLHGQVAELESALGEARAAVAAARSPEPSHNQRPHVPTGDLADLMSRTRSDVAIRRMRPSGDRRRLLRRAVVDVANASGVTDTRAALHALAVEALAWEHDLRGGGREIGRAAEDAAA
jgi:hypothetical protein